MFRSIALILSGNITNSALLLLRNLLIARMISVEDYGIAATFTLALAIIEMTSSFGIQQMLVRDQRGDDPRFQAALQGFQLLRGAFNALVLFLLAAPFAAFMGVPQVTWAHQLISVILLLNSLVHMDMHRLSRHMKFRAMALLAALSPLAALLAIWPLHMLYGDYRVMLWSLIIQAVATVLISHLVAERRYQLRLDRQLMRECMAFGWPLLFDGLLLFVIFNGEKIIVGREMGMELLALFTMAVTLTMTPSIILQRSAASFFLPQLSKLAGTPAFEGLARSVIMIHVAGAGLLVIGVMLCGPPFISLVLGAKYEGIGPLLNLFAIMHSIRTIKSGCSTVSISRGHTANGMASNILRALMLLPAWYVTVRGASVETLIWIGIGGEILGLAVAALLLRLQLQLRMRPLILPSLPIFALLVLAGDWAEQPTMSALWTTLPLALCLLSIALAGDLRHYVRNRGGALDQTSDQIRTLAEGTPSKG